MAHPLWLLGLFPWIVLTLYLLIGRRREFVVPFLPLWPRFESPSTTRRFQPPPPAIAAMLAAIALSILAAAGPRWAAHAPSDRPITILVDRGFSMSARDGDARRFQTLAAEASPEILRDFGPGPGQLTILPGSGALPVDRTDWADDLKPIGPTAAATEDAIVQSVQTALRNPRAIVILLSDQKIDASDSRLVQIVPLRPIDNVGIAAFSVRLAPTPQAMVRLVNDSQLKKTTLLVSGADAQVVDLPAAGKSADYFVNLKNPPDIMQAAIDPGGDIDADDRAWLVRQPAWPKIVSPIELPAELQRMVEVYMRNRAARSESKTISIAAFNSDLTADEIAVLLPTAADLNGSPPQSLRWETSPITESLDWTRILQDAQTAEAQPGADWKPLVRSGDHVLLAIHSDSPRRVWIGFSSPMWATTPDFVIFWTNVFDWLGQGGDQYTSTAIGTLSSQWKHTDTAISKADAGLWPGIYRRDDQSLAVDCAPIPLDPAEPTDWHHQLAALSADPSTDARNVGSWFLAAAIGCLLFAAIVLPSKTKMNTETQRR